MIKFGFKIRTRGGMIVDNLLITARDRAEADHKIMQIYQRCEVLECHESQPTAKEDGFSFESAITLIGREADPETPAKN